MTLKLNTVLEVVELDVRAKFHQAKCSGSWVINSALDFGQLLTLIANVSGTDQAIDNRKTALSTTIFFAFGKTNLVNFGTVTKKWPWPLTLKFNRVLEVVNDGSVKGAVACLIGRCVRPVSCVTSVTCVALDGNPALDYLKMFCELGVLQVTWTIERMAGGDPWPDVQTTRRAD